MRLVLGSTRPRSNGIVPYRPWTSDSSPGLSAFTLNCQRTGPVTAEGPTGGSQRSADKIHPRHTQLRAAHRSHLKDSLQSFTDADSHSTSCYRMQLNFLETGNVSVLEAERGVGA